jgi:hypothetical protein
MPNRKSSQSYSPRNSTNARKSYREDSIKRARSFGENAAEIFWFNSPEEGIDELCSASKFSMKEMISAVLGMVEYMGDNSDLSASGVAHLIQSHL